MFALQISHNSDLPDIDDDEDDDNGDGDGDDDDDDSASSMDELEEPCDHGTNSSLLYYQWITNCCCKLRKNHWVLQKITVILQE